MCSNDSDSRRSEYFMWSIKRGSIKSRKCFLVFFIKLNSTFLPHLVIRGSGKFLSSAQSVFKDLLRLFYLEFVEIASRRTYRKGFEKVRAQGVALGKEKTKSLSPRALWCRAEKGRAVKRAVRSWFNV